MLDIYIRFLNITHLKALETVKIVPVLLECKNYASSTSEWNIMAKTEVEVNISRQKY